jgi:hypothetical protein
VIRSLGIWIRIRFIEILSRHASPIQGTLPGREH